MDIKEVLLLRFINFLIKKPSFSGVNNEIKKNEQLAEKLHKPIIIKFKKRKVYSSFKEQYSGFRSYTCS